MTRRSKTNLSRILDKHGNSKTVVESLKNTSESFFLNIGITFAVFKFSGTMPVDSDRLKIMVRSFTTSLPALDKIPNIIVSRTFVWVEFFNNLYHVHFINWFQIFRYTLLLLEVPKYS